MHPTCSIEVIDVTGSVIVLYCTYVHYTRKKYAVRIRNAKKVRHLLALQSARAARRAPALPVVAAGRLQAAVPDTAVGKACALPWRGLVRGEKPAFTVLTPTFRAARGSFHQIRKA